jgi:hypothetical protein
MKKAIWILKVVYTIVLKPGPTRRVNPGLELGRVEEKIRKVMTRRVDSVKNPVATR